MKKRTCIIAQDLSMDLDKKIRATLPDWNILIGKDASVWKNHLLDAEVIAGWKGMMETDCLDQSQSRLAWVQSWSAGIDTMPIAKFQSRNVIMTTASGVHAYPIAETVFAYMLGLTRKIHTYVRNQEKKIWNHEGLDGEIHGKRLLIVGVGAIGKEIAKIAKAFSMQVIGIRNSAEQEEYVDEMHGSSQLDEQLRHADYIVVTVPLTKQTKGMFTAEQFNLMKSSSIFINIGRGEVVCEEALVDALTTGQIAGAGLDVFKQEPLPKDSPFWEMDNVIITPHTSGSTKYYQSRVIEDIFLPNMEMYIKGLTPTINRVDYDKEY